MMAGSTPAVAKEAMRASGFKLRFAASAPDITTSTAAPSLMPEALPAVTVPSFEKAGRSFRNPSMVASWRMNSSSETTTSPFLVFTVTGTISSLNRPDFWAALALSCEPKANSSCCSRVIWKWSPRSPR